MVAREHDTLFLAMLRYVKVTHALYGDCWWPQVSRLTFGVYLTHFMCVRLNYYSVQQKFDYTDYLGAYFMTANYTLALVLSFALYMLVEKPFANLIMILFAPPRRPPKGPAVQ